MKQHPGHGLPKPTRPESAKYSNKRSRPPSGKKPRPQSAKEPIGDQTQSHGTRQGFGGRLNYLLHVNYVVCFRKQKSVHVFELVDVEEYMK